MPEANAHTVPMITVGEAAIALLEAAGARAAYGVISIHNMPLLDAIAQRGVMRFVPARGEAGAANMADAHARTSGTLGVCITSTGTGCGNAAGALVEAQTAGTPLLHLTGQIEVPYLDRDMAYIHEARDQLGMLKAVGKAAFRVRSAETALGTLKLAIQTALTAPTGPVSVEIPIDVQQALIPAPSAAALAPLPVLAPPPDAAALDALADALASARRPLLWLGGGARHAGPAVQRLLALGFGLVTSTQGRGVVSEDHPRCLGAFTIAAPVQALYAQCDALLVVGSRLRGNETLKYQLKLPATLHRIDADATADGRGYANTSFLCADAALALNGLADRLEARAPARAATDPAWADALVQARRAAEATLVDGLGPYAGLLAALQARVGRDFFWVRDVTLSNSIWGNRLPALPQPRAGVHALGGGIGQGLAMGIGAAVSAALHSPGTRSWCLVGDGGFILNLGELATAVQEQADLSILLMNDRGYGVIKNIQDAHYGGRQVYADLHTPDYAQLSAAIGLAHRRVATQAALEAALDEAVAPGARGPRIIEVDMLAFGPFKTTFAGPPVKAKAH